MARDGLPSAFCFGESPCGVVFNCIGEKGEAHLCEVKIPKILGCATWQLTSLVPKREGPGPPSSAHSTLKRGANIHCVYNAGQLATIGAGHYSAKISPRVSSVALKVPGAMAPERLTRRVLSTARI